MATPRTEITEIVSGLGMLGFASLEHALTVREPYGVWGGLTEEERLAVYAGVLPIPA